MNIKELAEQAGYLPDMFGIGHWDTPECKRFAELVVAAALAQPEPWDTFDMAYRPNGLSVEQAPVAWLVSDAQGRYATIRDPAPYGEEVYEPLYAAPVSKPWFGLTDIEVGKYSSRLNGGDIAREVEAKLKELNHG